MANMETCLAYPANLMDLAKHGQPLLELDPNVGDALTHFLNGIKTFLPSATV